MANEPTCKHCGGRIQNVQNRLVHVATGFRRCAGDRGVAEPEMANEPKVSHDFEGVDFSKHVVLWCDLCQAFHSEASGCAPLPKEGIYIDHDD